MKKIFVLALAALMSFSAYANVKDWLKPMFGSKDFPSYYHPVVGEHILDIPDMYGYYSIFNEEDENSPGCYRLVFLDFSSTGPEGNIVNCDYLEIFLPVNPTGGYANIAGEYTPGSYNIFTGEGEVEPYKFIPGVYVEVGPDFFLPFGTHLVILDEEARMDTIGTAVGGSINVTPSGEEGVFRFEFNLITPEEAVIKGSWEGDITECIENLPGEEEYANEKTLRNNIRVKVEGRTLCTGQEMEVYNILGQHIGRSSTGCLTVDRPGLYIVKTRTGVAKVTVR